MADSVTALSIAKDFGVPLCSAVLGAMLAYVPAARLAKKASDEMLARDREQRVETELADPCPPLVLFHTHILMSESPQASIAPRISRKCRQSMHR